LKGDTPFLEVGPKHWDELSDMFALRATGNQREVIKILEVAKKSWLEPS
jgi:carbonic anhydrase